MFTCSDLAVARGGQPVLRELTLELIAGDLIALVGPNGSGKTTWLEAIAGLAPISDGRLHLMGERIDELPAFARAQRGIRLIRDRNMVFPNLTLAENLGAFQTRQAREGIRRQVALEELGLPSLDSAREAGALSGGQKRILATLSALEAQPRVLLADEFSEGLQQSVVNGLLERVRERCRQGMAGVLVVHSEAFARERGLVVYTILEGALRRV